jgi:hypothetical protein
VLALVPASVAFSQDNLIYPSISQLMDLLGHLSVTIGLGQIIYFIVSRFAHLLAHEKKHKKCSLKAH